MKAFFARAAASIKDASPEILMGVGIVSLVAAGVLACLETQSAGDILDEQEEKKAQIIENHSVEEQELPEVKHELRWLKVKTVGRLAWHYAPAIGLTVLGVTSVLVGHKIIRGRYLAAVATANVIQTAYDKAMERVQEKWGDGGVKYVKYGIEEEEYTEKETDPETGKKVNVTKTRDIPKEVNYLESTSPYTVVFDENTSLYKDNQGSIVHMRSQAEVYQAGINEQYNAGIPVYYDELITMFCGPDSELRTDELRNTGWYKRDKKNREDGDDCIDLHIGTFMGCDPETGEPKMYLFMDPNVPGIVSLNAGKNRIRTGGKYISQV